MARIRTFTKIINLDTVFSRRVSDGNHWIGSTVKAFRVIETNNDGFSLSIVADPDSGSVEGLPLSDVRVHNYTVIANRAVFENDTPQPGVYVKVLISVEDDFIYAGDKKTGGNSVILSGGNGFSNDKVAVSNVASPILAADDSRASSKIYNTTLETIYVGSQAKISAGDFSDTCIPVTPGQEFIWDMPDALYARTIGAGPFNPIILTKDK